MSVKAGASVDSLVSALCKKLGVTVSHDDVGVFDGSGSKIDNRRVLVKSFPSTNFSFCRLPLSVDLLYLMSVLI